MLSKRLKIKLYVSIYMKYLVKAKLQTEQISDWWG